MKISRINPQTNLITKKNNFHNNSNIVSISSSSKENNTSFKGVFINKAKKLIQELFSTKKRLISKINANDINKTQNIQQDTPLLTKKLNDQTKPITTEIRETIAGQPINDDNENKNDFSANIEPQTNKTNLLTLYTKRK